MKLLIVDDESYMVEYIKKLVNWKEYGFDSIYTACGGSLARDLLIKHRPELLITDIRMPRVSGLDLAALVEEQRLGTRVIVVSGYSDFSYARQAMRYGVSEYLVKPVLKQDLQETLDRIMQKKQEITGEKGEEEPVPSNDRGGVIADVKKYVCEHFDEPLSLEILGERVHLHPAYLSGIFKETTGVNLSCYITEIRLNKAAELLEQTDLKVNEVMKLIGYQKSQHFSRLFKEKYGVTPMEYKRLRR